MSRLSKSQLNGVGLEGLVQRIGTEMRSKGTSFATPEQTQGVLSLESLPADQFDSVSRRYNDLTDELKGFWKEAFGMESLKPSVAQLEAGAIAAMAYGDPVAYATKAASNVQAGVSRPNMRVIEAPSMESMHYNMVPAMESFNETELRNHLAWSVGYNIMAARQGEFAERFYPTVVVSPDQAGLDISVRRTMVLNEVRHQLTGVGTVDFNRRNLIEGVIDATLLANESTAIIPMVVTGGANDNTQFFVASGDVAPYNVNTDAGQTVLTAPLKFGVAFDLLGLSQRTDIQTQGQFDYTDELDPRVMLGKLYLKVTDNTAPTALVDIIPVDVSRAPRNQWVKSVEGNYRELNLNYTTVDIPLTGLTQNLAGIAAPALAFLTGARANWIVRLGVSIGGQCNVQTGMTNATASTVTIEKIFLNDPTTGDQTDITNEIYSGSTTNKQQLAAELPGLSMIGFDVIATRSNLNRRTSGLLLDNTEYTERYTIALTAPVTIKAPIGSQRDSSDMTTLINAVRIRNDNLAVTTLLSYRDALAALKSPTNRSAPVPAIEGMGRYLVRPFYESRDLDVLASINTLMSHDRMEDVRATLINAIREVSYRMYRDSGYQPALDAQTGGSGERPIVLIGTDSVIAKYLMVTGDTRTLGIGLESEVVVSLDSRMWGQIVVTLTRAAQTGADPLCFGQMAWIPELASTVQVTRNGATIKEPMVQPRMRHINNLPLMAWFNVKNLKEAVADNVPVNMHTV